MALVYRAHDLVLNRPVAVKVLRPQFASDEDFLRRFRREAQAAASLSHPNIVGVYDVGSDGETHYMVMEFIDGITLKERIQQGRALPVGEALDIAYQICEALEHAHQNRIIHRDIKPHNIMLTRNGRVKVTDFGIARAVTSATLTHTGAILGSVHYVSPEQAKGGLAGAKSDLYSVGVVLYEMLTGTLPFHGETAVTIALKHVDERVIPPRSVNLTIPLDVERLVMRALEKDAMARYASAADMMADIGRCLARLRSSGPAPATPPVALPPRRVEKTASRPTVARARAHPEPPAPRPPQGADKEEVPVVRRRRSPYVRALQVLLVLLALMAGGIYLIWDWLHVPTVEVPSVVGMTYLEAQEVLRERGLTAEQVANRAHPEVPANHIIEQVQLPGTIVRRGRAIGLVVSLGQPTAVVPDLTRLSEREADIQLINSGLAMGGIAYEYHAEIPEGGIISQSPRPGTRVATGTLVDVRVSRGPAVPLVVIPDFRGQQLEGVLAQLAGLHLRGGTLHQQSSEQPAGVVLRQLPEPGHQVPRDTAVELWYSRGTPEPRHEQVVTFTVPAGLPTAMVEWVLADATGMSVIYRQSHAGGREITRTVRWHGATARLRILVNDEVHVERMLVAPR